MTISLLNIAELDVTKFWIFAVFSFDVTIVAVVMLAESAPRFVISAVGI